MAGFKNVCGMLVFAVVGLFFASACGVPTKLGNTVDEGGGAQTALPASSTPTESSSSAPGSGWGPQSPPSSTPPTGACVIDGAGYQFDDTLAGNDCESCQPGRSTVDWTPRAAGTACSSGNGSYCSGGTCLAGCLVGGQLYASQQLEPSDACRICDPAQSTTAFSKVAHCTSHKNSCDIGGTGVSPGAPEPGNANACCNPELSATSWSPAFEAVDAGFATFQNVETVSLADISNDGQADLVISTSTGLEFMVGKPGGAFMPIEDIGGGVIQAATADLNGDGRPDVIVLSQDDTDQIASVTVLLNMAVPDEVGFTSQAYSVPWPTVGFAVGDFRYQGSRDIAVVGGSTQATLTTLLNGGTGKFAKVANGGLEGVSPSGVVSGKFGGGLIDGLAIADGANHTVSVLAYVGGTLGFVPTAQTVLPIGPVTLSLASADINEDGLADLLIGDVDDDQLFVLQNAGSATFDYAGVYPVTAPAQLAVGDYNGDGLPDIACASGAAGVNVLLNEPKDGVGGAHFSPAANYPVQAAAVAAGAVNADGKVDLVAVGGGVTTLLGSCQ